MCRNRLCLYKQMWNFNKIIKLLQLQNSVASVITTRTSFSPPLGLGRTMNIAPRKWLPSAAET